MKILKILTLLFLLANANVLSGQYACFDDPIQFYFDESTPWDRLNIDTINYKHNIWQIAEPYKITLVKNNCESEVIITDSSKPYPVNNLSVFTIKSAVTPGMVHDYRMFSGIYYVETDSLKDYGTMEFSPDCGITWIDMLNDKKYQQCFQWDLKPTLTGRSFYCHNFGVMFNHMPEVFGLQVGDTVMFRFKFISDSIFDNMGGLFYDNLRFLDVSNHFTELRFKLINSNIVQEPGTQVFNISFDNPTKNPFDLTVYNIRNKTMLQKMGITGNSVKIDMSPFLNDVYIYKLIDVKGYYRNCGTFRVGM